MNGAETVVKIFTGQGVTCDFGYREDLFWFSMKQYIS